MTTETIREVANREADEAERDEDDAQADDAPTVDPTENDEALEEAEREEVPEPPSDAVIEKTYRAIRTKAENYTKAQSALLAETGIPWEQCPTCQVAGFVAPFDPNDADDWSRKQITDAYFGGTEPEYKPAPHSDMCATCDGEGQVLSGAKRRESRLIACPDCSGLGYRVKATPPPPPAPTTYAQPGVTPPGVAPAELQAPDLWQRPYGHPHYGQPPALVGV